MGISKYKGIYRDVYLLHEKYSGVLEDGAWAELVDDMRVLSKKYGESKFVIDFLIIVIDEIEREYLSTRQDI